MNELSLKQDRELDASVQSVLRGLATIWLDFEQRLERVPLIERLLTGRLRMNDYQQLLCNLRQQVVDGGLWIARAASNIDEAHFALRSRFMQHCVTEHRDYQLLERDYVAVGGNIDVIRTTEKNIGSEAFSAWMFHRASQPNPFDLLGAVFIIEGLGQRKGREWADAIRDQLNLDPSQVSFLAYHGANDEDHLEDFEQMLRYVAADRAVCNAILKTAKVTARLYLLQLEEMGNR